MDFYKLANDLIELQQDRPSFGTFYDFLLKVYGDADAAKADFISFVSGGLPPRMLEAATEWILEENAADTAFSPVCERLEHTEQLKHHINQEQLLSETTLEAASN